MAARAGHTEVAKYLLQNKAKVNAKAKVGSGGGSSPDMSLEVQEELRGRAAGLWGRLLSRPRGCTQCSGSCFAGLLEKARCVLASELFL